MYRITIQLLLHSILLSAWFVPLAASEQAPEQTLQSYVDLLRENNWGQWFQDQAKTTQIAIRTHAHSLKNGLKPSTRHQIDATLSLLQQDNAPQLLCKLLLQTSQSIRALSKDQQLELIKGLLRNWIPAKTSQDPDHQHNRKVLIALGFAAFELLSQEPDKETLLKTCQEFCQQLKTRQLTSLKQIELLDEAEILAELEYWWASIKKICKTHGYNIDDFLSKMSYSAREIDALNRIIQLNLPSKQGRQQLRLHVHKHGQHWRISTAAYQIPLTP